MIERHRHEKALSWFAQQEDQAFREVGVKQSSSVRSAKWEIEASRAMAFLQQLDHTVAI